MKYHKVLINMYEWIDIINSQNTFIPKNIIEIGSLHGNDCNILEQQYKTNNVIIFEAHRVYYNIIQKKYPSFKVFNLAITNKNQEVIFNETNESISNIGISSMLKRKNKNYTEYKIMGMRMDSFILNNNINDIDLLKIDVEGYSKQVLESFGNHINKIKCIHIENEYVQIWNNQSLYNESDKILINNDFILVSIKAAWPQTDSVWIHKKYWNSSWWKH